MSFGPLGRIARLSTARSRRFSSFDRSGGNRDNIPVPAGATVTLVECEGAGAVTHMWFTISSRDPLHKRNLILRAYWDGQEHPSVEAPIGDFFGQGWGEDYLFASLPLAAAPRDGKALVSYFPMPFGRGARITLENMGSEDTDALYFYIDVELVPDLPDDVGRFHAWYNRELTEPESSFGDRENEWGVLGETPKNPTDEHNYLFCEAEGQGHFVGVNYFVQCPSPIWYGEGDDMFCVDGEPWPFSAHGTGTEDYFNMSWSPDEPYRHPYFGCARAPGFGNKDPRFGWMGRTHCYRFHLDDPIRFQRSLRASIEAGHANVLTLDIASVAYWYQSLPSKPFPPLADRSVREDVGVVDVHRWRDAWRQSKGGGRIWGKE